MLGGDVAQVTHIMSAYGENLLNVYYFEAVDGTADIGELLSWFSTNVVPDVKAAQSGNVTHTALEGVNIFDKGETDTLALSGQGGLQVGETMPTFTAGSLRLLHSTAGIRSGWKRVGPATEDQQAGGIWIAGYVTLLQNVGVHLVNPLTPALATWAHVIVGRIKDCLLYTSDAADE